LRIAVLNSLASALDIVVAACLWAGAGLTPVDLTSIEVATDYWRPFTLGAGPAPGYCVSLAPEARQRVKQILQEDLPRRADGSIHFKARALAVRATSD
jgi:hypothetical protein